MYGLTRDTTLHPQIGQSYSTLTYAISRVVCGALTVPTNVFLCLPHSQPPGTIFAVQDPDGVQQIGTLPLGLNFLHGPVRDH